MRISVIMASFLGQYPNCASNRTERFRKAVNSFLLNFYKDKELIIVSDGCPDTINIVRNEYREPLLAGNIILVEKRKQPLFSGYIRQAGIKKATGKIITYLDTDDKIGKRHLSNIVQQFILRPELDWIYYDDYLDVYDSFHTNGQTIPKSVSLEHGSVGTSSIAHRNIQGLFKKSISWKGCNGYGHDWKFIQRLMKNFPAYKKVDGGEYYICHMPNYFGE